MKQYIGAFLLIFAFSLKGYTAEAHTREISYFGLNGEVFQLNVICKERHYSNPEDPPRPGTENAFRPCTKLNIPRSVAGIELNDDGSPKNYYAFINNEKNPDLYIKCFVNPKLNLIQQDKNKLVLKVLLEFRTPHVPQSDVPHCCKLMTVESEANDIKNDCKS